MFNIFRPYLRIFEMGCTKRERERGRGEKRKKERGRKSDIFTLKIVEVYWGTHGVHGQAMPSLMLFFCRLQRARNALRVGKNRPHFIDFIVFVHPDFRGQQLKERKHVWVPRKNCTPSANVKACVGGQFLKILWQPAAHPPQRPVSPGNAICRWPCTGEWPSVWWKSWYQESDDSDYHPRSLVADKCYMKKLKKGGHSRDHLKMGLAGGLTVRRALTWHLMVIEVNMFYNKSWYSLIWCLNNNVTWSNLSYPTFNLHNLHSNLYISYIQPYPTSVGPCGLKMSVELPGHDFMVDGLTRSFGGSLEEKQIAPPEVEGYCHIA